MKNSHIKSYFASHPKEVSVLHFAPDGTPFFEKGKAEDYANGKGDDPTKVKTITRDQAEALADDEGTPPVQKGYADMKKAELHELLNERKIEFDPKVTKTNADCIALLEQWDADQKEGE